MQRQSHVARASLYRYAPLLLTALPPACVPYYRETGSHLLACSTCRRHVLLNCHPPWPFRHRRDAAAAQPVTVFAILPRAAAAPPLHLLPHARMIHHQVTAPGDQNFDYVGDTKSCGRCYEVKCSNKQLTGEYGTASRKIECRALSVACRFGRHCLLPLPPPPAGEPMDESADEPNRQSHQKSERFSLSQEAFICDTHPGFTALRQSQQQQLSPVRWMQLMTRTIMILGDPTAGYFRWIQLIGG